jgi:hypothetical protein
MSAMQLVEVFQVFGGEIQKVVALALHQEEAVGSLVALPILYGCRKRR